MSPKPTNISHLSRAQKLALYDALQERKRRARESKQLYQPNEGQLPFHSSTKMVRINASGNGAGKTTAAIHEAVWRCQGYHPVKKIYTKVPTEVIVLLDQARKADDVWVKEMRRWFNIRDEQLKKMGKPFTSAIEFDNGSRMSFLTQEAPEQAFEGISGHSLVVADEPCPHWQYVALFRGARDKEIQPEFLIIGTPLGPNATWIRQMWAKWAKGELDYVDCFRMASYVNEDNLPEGFLDKFGDQLSETEKQVRLHGQFSDLEGQALAHLFKRDTHTIPRSKLNWNRDYPVVISIDPHTSKKHVAVMLGVDRENRLIALEEYSEKATARQFARSLIKLKWFADYRVIDIVYDSAGNADMTSGEGFEPFGKIFNQELERAQVGRARATTYDDKLDAEFIERIRDALLLPDEPDSGGAYIPKLRYVDDLKGLITDTEEVAFQRNKAMGMNKDVLDIRNTDFLACLKYALATNLYFKKPRDKAYVYNRPIYGFKTPSQRRHRPKLTG
jgi:hypothetical protein